MKLVKDLGFLAVVQPKATDDDLLFALIQAGQNPLDLGFSQMLSTLLLVQPPAEILCRHKHLVSTCSKSIAML